MRRYMIAGCLAVVFAAPAYARGHHKKHHARKHPKTHAVVKADASFFLAGDPHVPLAVVKSGKISDDAFSGEGCGEKKRWKTLGSKWQALDMWGQPLGVFTAKTKDDYDATGCAELSFERALADDLSHVFVSIDSPWTAPTSAQWTVPDGRRMDLVALAKAKINDTKVAPNLVWTQCSTLPERERFFQVPGRGEWAIATSNTGWLVARNDAAGWTATTVDVPQLSPPSVECFRPLAIFDMSGDGIPEIILRSSGGDGWNEVVLELQSDDSWQIVSTSPGGSTA